MEPTGTSGSPYIFAAPLLPGKEEPWRRFLQEVAESRMEYERLRRCLGIHRELVWLVPSPSGYATVVVYLEADGDLSEIVRRLAVAGEAFDLWFKERIVECHGRAEAAKSLPGSTLVPIFSWGEDP